MAEQLAGQTTIFEALSPADIPLMEAPNEALRLMTAVIKTHPLAGGISHHPALAIAAHVIEELEGAGFKIMKQEGSGE